MKAPLGLVVLWHPNIAGVALLLDLQECCHRYGPITSRWARCKVARWDAGVPVFYIKSYEEPCCCFTNACLIHFKMACCKLCVMPVAHWPPIHFISLHALQRQQNISIDLLVDVVLIFVGWNKHKTNSKLSLSTLHTSNRPKVVHISSVLRLPLNRDST